MMPSLEPDDESEECHGEETGALRKQNSKKDTEKIGEENIYTYSSGPEDDDERADPIRINPTSPNQKPTEPDSDTTLHH